MNRLGSTWKACLVLATLAFAPVADAAVVLDPPGSQVRTVQQLIDANPTGDIHIILIHGMRTSDRTTWVSFRAKLCAHLNHQCVVSNPLARVTEQLNLSARPADANFLGNKIWTTDDQWVGSRPFIDHYLFTLKNSQQTRRLIVDEINWWPMLFAFKCQFVVPYETDFVGPDKDNIEACSMSQDMHFAWYDPQTEATLLADRPSSGGAPAINKGLKTGVMDWGIADAVLSLGTLKGYLRETVRCAFADIANFDPKSFEDAAATASGAAPYDCATAQPPSPSLEQSDVQFVVISHSLGAFLLMDTFAAAAADANDFPQPGPDRCKAASAKIAPSGEPSVGSEVRSRSNQSLCFVLAKSANLYFFANQFPLLELARAQGVPSSPPQLSSEPASSTNALTLWATTNAPPGSEKQIVAFSDPGDILTFKIPRIDGAEVVNAYVKNDFRWFGLFEWPITAHMNYISSDEVLRTVFGE
jgi:hypothetical protein